MVGPTDFGRKADLQGGVGKDGIPLGDLAILLPLEGHRLGAIEHRAQGHPAEGHEVIGQGADQRLGRFIGHHGDLDPARPLQTRGKEVDTRGAAVTEADLDLSEIMLGEFTRETLEAHLHLHLTRAQRGDQFVQRGLAASIALQPRPAQDLDREQHRLLPEHVGNQLPVGLGGAGASDAMGLHDVLELRHRSLQRDTAHGAFVDADEARHIGRRVAGGHQHLDGVAFERREHWHLQKWR